MQILRKLWISALSFIAPGVEFKDYNLLNKNGKQETPLSWIDGCKKMRKLLPILWPKNNLEMQFRIFLCICLLIAERFLNIMVPIYNQKIVDSLGDKVFCWNLIVIYCGYKYLQGSGDGSMGLLNNFRSILWKRIEEYMSCELQVGLFAHLHGLSLRWHLQRKTGEILQVMDRGSHSVTALVNYAIFTITPTIFDVVTSVIFLSLTFNWYFGLIMFTAMILYIRITVIETGWGGKFQRNRNSAHNEQKSRSIDSLLNFETVKYYGAEKFEIDAYRKAISDYQKEAFMSRMTVYLRSGIQDIIICGSLLVGSLICAYLVVDVGSITPGQYVLFTSYIVQLYNRLNWLGNCYRHIQRCFVDMESMFDVLNEKAEVVDAPDALQLSEIQGDIKFSNVTFGYTPDRVILKDVSFSVKAGKTIAFVGPTGSGKSTIIRLLFRFYDIDSGSICIDGQNVKKVKQDSLRAAIGVVPQDTVLFNNSINYNIKYGRLTASDEEVDAAARSADIHEHIMHFPDKYETKVGERGLRLSGGEKQRVAIARTILKAPSIMLLDEATSSLDINTERNIQTALSTMCANRTTIIVAHRLSTITHADEILVLKEGEIVERGRHDDLLKKDGFYASMWHQQFQNDQSDSVQLISVEEDLPKPDLVHRRKPHNSDR